MLLDALKEIVSHTSGLGFIDLVKITGTADSTQLNAIADDRSVVIQGVFATPLAEFEGVFGMPNLSKLTIILGIPEYKEDATISVIKQKNSTGKEVISGINFTNKNNDFKNDYRLMSEEVVSSRLPNSKFNEPIWDVEFEPSSASIQKLKFQSLANSDEKNVVVTTDKNKNLMFTFGDHSTHAGNFVFEANVKGQLKQAWAYPIAQLQSVLNLIGEKKMKFSNSGAMVISVNSGLATYEFIFPALQQ